MRREKELRRVAFLYCPYGLRRLIVFFSSHIPTAGASALPSAPSCAADRTSLALVLSLLASFSVGCSKVIVMDVIVVVVINHGLFLARKASSLSLVMA